MRRKRWSKAALSLLTAFLVGATTIAGSLPYGMLDVSAKNADEQSALEEPVLVSETEKENGALTQGETEKEEMAVAGQSGDAVDFRDETIYFVMTTRFYDGDSSNNVQCWDAQNLNTNDPPWRGDFKGLIEKLDYIKALGFTAIWITPVVENASGYDYHGYHAMNFSKVDPRYESDDCTYQDLIDEAHARGIKVIQDVVFNHTGNWGESNLYNIASKDYTKDLSNADESMVPNYAGGMPSDYTSLTPQQMFETRANLLMKADKDTNNIYHHNDYIKSWETYGEQNTSIAGDCIDLNTENPYVYHYLVDAYSNYIKMGVDAFRVDTVKHISRLTYNKALIAGLNDAYNEVHGTSGEGNFYMFGEVCTRVRDVWNRGIPALSCPFYTWKESKDYAWDDSETAAAITTNEASVKQAYEDNSSLGNNPTSNNAFLNGNDYHSVDRSQASGLSVIDFPMHWNFKYARDAFGVAVGGDQYYNDATYNVTYVDSHDYAPDGAPEDQRFAESQAQWAENLSLMFTFRGIPCIYYGSEVEFKKGCPIDKGPTVALDETGRAYFGDYIEGSVDAVGFGRYQNATGKMAETLSHPLSMHIQRLNRLRAAIPALRKGQYSTEGCNGNMAFKRRYTDADTDSFVLVTVSGDATFSGIPNGTYTDAITGDTQNVTGGTLSTSGCSGQGDLRVYVLSTSKTPAPGMIDGKSQYLSGGTDALDFSKVEQIGGKVDVTGLTLDQTSASLDLGETVKLKATIAPSNATSKGVKWTSSNPAVATVNGGTVTAKSEGTTTITATSTSNQNASATATIKVEAKGVKVTGVTLSPTSVKMRKADTQQLTATITPSNADAKYAKLTWTSSDPSVVKVDENGLLTGTGGGTATITAQTATGISASVTVTVKDTGVNMHVNAVYFEKPSGWGKTIHAYFWNQDETYKNHAWPGEAMTLLDENAGVYGYKWPEGQENAALKVIFNDGGNQTADLTATMNGYYNSSGNVVKTIDPNEKEEEEEDPVIPSIQASLASGSTIKEKTSVTFTLTNAASGSYQVNGGSASAINGSTVSVEIGDGMTNGETVTIVVSAVSTTGDSDTKQFVYTFQSEVTGHVHQWSSDYVTDWEPTCTQAGSKSIHCTECDAVKDGSETTIPALGHTGGTASCSAKAVCARCGTAYGDYDNTKHLHTELVNAVTASCQQAGYSGDTRCTDCGNIIEEGVSTSKAAHSWNAGVVTTPATDTTDGIRTYTCTVCGQTREETINKEGGSSSEHVHQWSSEYVTDYVPTCEYAGRKSIHCVGCDAVQEGSETEIPALGHTGGTATCSAKAKCARCGMDYGEIDSAHHMNTELVNVVTATCKAEGYTGDIRCKDCGEVLTQGTKTEKGTHSWNEGVVTTPATQTTDGVKTYTCSVCGETKTEKIPKISEESQQGHVHQWAIVPTVDIEATCTQAGSQSIHCKECDAVKEGSESSIPALGHTGGTATCGAKAVCARCGLSYGTLDTTKHLHTEIVNNKAATCQAEGYTGDTRCKDCGNVVKKGTAIAKTAHSWGTGVVTQPATETADGIRTYTCKVCGEKKTETIARTGSSGGQQSEESGSTDAQISAPEEELDEGDLITDSKTGNVYRITKLSTSDKTVEYAILGKKSKTVVVPDNVVINGVSYKVTSIAESAFKNNKTVKSVTIGNNVKTIGSKAFYGCKNLTMAVLSKNLTSIGSGAFYKCTKLTSITIPEKVTKIGSKAFYGDKSLKLVSIKTTKLTSKKIGSKAFKGIVSKATIKVPKSKLKTYKKALRAKGVSTKAAFEKQ